MKFGEKLTILSAAEHYQFYHEKPVPYAREDRLSLLNVPDNNELSFVKK